MTSEPNEQSSDSVVDYVNRGVNFLEEGEYVKAIVEFNAAISINPDEPVAYINRGNAFAADVGSRNLLSPT